MGVDIISLHAFAGYRALKISKEASLEGAKEVNINPPELVGITVLTSFSEKEFLDDLNIKTSIKNNVSNLAKLSFNSGLNGCVCSPYEVKNLRLTHGMDFQLITPGIRMKADKKYDQTRVMTPYESIYNGASRIVVGRSITNAEDPNQAFLNICRNIRSNS